MNLNHISAVSIVKGETDKQTKKIVSLQEMVQKVEMIEKLEEDLKNMVLDGNPEYDADNYDDLEFLKEVAGGDSPASNALNYSDLLKRLQVCGLICQEEARKYESM